MHVSLRASNTTMALNGLGEPNCIFVVLSRTGKTTARKAPCKNPEASGTQSFDGDHNQDSSYRHGLLHNKKDVENDRSHVRERMTPSQEDGRGAFVHI